MPSAVTTRRSVLRGIAGLGIGVGIGVLTGGCTKAPAADLPASGREVDRDRAADLAVVGRALATSRVLAQRYAATVAAFPELAGALAPLEIEHAAHIAALDTTPASAAPSAPSGTASSPSGTTSSPSGTASESSGTGSAPSGTAPAPSGTDSESSAPAAPGEALAALAAAERASAAARVADLLTCSPAVARLLASIAACQATHAAVLGTVT